MAEKSNAGARGSRDSPDPERSTAASYLRRVRDLFDGLGEQETWRTLIAELRERNQRLHALKDELNKTGL
jgi:uncharacterized Zn finger protein